MFNVTCNVMCVYHMLMKLTYLLTSSIKTKAILIGFSQKHFMGPNMKYNINKCLENKEMAKTSA